MHAVVNEKHNINHPNLQHRYTRPLMMKYFTKTKPNKLVAMPQLQFFSVETKPLGMGGQKYVPPSFKIFFVTLWMT